MSSEDRFSDLPNGEILTKAIIKYIITRDSGELIGIREWRWKKRGVEVRTF
jgi:hypothetical protein